MTPKQIAAAKSVERALKAAKKSGLRLFAYTDFGLFLSATPMGAGLGRYDHETQTAWRKTTYELPIDTLGDAGAGV